MNLTCKRGIRMLAMAITSCLSSVAIGTHAAEQRIACPKHLAPEAIQPNQPPAGWALYMPHGVRLSEGGMLHGPADQSGYMVPYESKRSKSGSRITQTDRWIFHAPEGYQTWVYCGYGGAGSPLQIFKPVADDATECTLTSISTDGRAKEIAEFICH